MDDWDPLGVLSSAETSKALAPAHAAPAVPVATGKDTACPRSPYLDWPSRRGAILKEFTLLGSVKVADDFGGQSGDNDEAETQQLPLAKARQRLEALEAASKGVHTQELTQMQYEERIRTMSVALENAWGSGHRVASLKIAIQAAKLLTDARTPGFYPSAFVLVTDVLDKFGELVFSRLKAIADEEHKRINAAAGVKRPQGLPDSFIAADVGAEARETAKNWMYKVACIRELLPRLYIEMALLPCYRFIFDADFASILMRLASAIRGVGDPLVASYARFYLCRAASIVSV
jgi:hypothetical protein